MTCLLLHLSLFVITSAVMFLFEFTLYNSCFPTNERNLFLVQVQFQPLYSFLTITPESQLTSFLVPLEAENISPLQRYFLCEWLERVTSLHMALLLCSFNCSEHEQILTCRFVLKMKLCGSN